MKCQNQTSILFKSQNKSVFVHVFFVLFIVCLYICVCEWILQNNNHKTKNKNNTTSKQHSCVRGPLQECRSIRSGASGLPYYCAPLVCVSNVTDSLAVWRHNKPRTKNRSQWKYRIPIRLPYNLNNTHGPGTRTHVSCSALSSLVP